MINSSQDKILASSKQEDIDSGGEEDANCELNKTFTSLEMDTFKKTFPSRNIFTFPHGVIITSDFD